MEINSFFIQCINMDDKVELVPALNIQSLVNLGDNSKIRLNSGVEIITKTKCHTLEMRLNQIYLQFINLK